MPTARFNPTENILNARPSIDFVHQQIHAGLHFVATYVESVGTATAVTVLVSAPATNDYHLVLSVESDKAGTWQWSEAPNASGGDSITAYNSKRGNTNEDTLTLTSAVTYVSSGTVLEQHLMGGTTNPANNTGGTAEARGEWKLNQSTLYLLKYDATGASTNCMVNLYYYRESA